MTEPADVPRPRSAPIAVVIALLVGLALGVGLGILVAPDDTANDDERNGAVDTDPGTDPGANPDASGAPTTVVSSSTTAAAPLELEPTLRRYLDALVTHDWPTAHSLMCADLAEQISAGGLKQELAGSEERAGPLTGYEIGSDLAPAERTAEVEYVLTFEQGAIDITASMEREGDTWRVCSFTNTGGTGAFASS